MSLTDYTQLINQLIVANQTKRFKEAAILKDRAREAYSALSEIEREKTKNIVAMLTMYHNA